MSNKPTYNPDLNILSNDKSINENDLKTAFANTNIASLLEKVCKNPDDLNKLLHDSVDNITPDMLNNAKKMLGTGQGEQLLKSLQQKGINPNNLKTKLSAHNNAFKNILKPGNKSPTRKCILITTNRQLKIRNLPIDDMSKYISTILKVDSPLSTECTRLSIDVFKDKKLTIWYDKNKIGKNKRATKIAGFTIAGDIIISILDEDINESDFLIVEKFLSKE
jgi:hypothetical protein